MSSNGKRNGIYTVLAIGATVLVFVLGNNYNIVAEAEKKVAEVEKLAIQNDKSIAVLEREILIRLERIETDIKAIKGKLDVP